MRGARWLALLAVAQCVLPAGVQAREPASLPAALVGGVPSSRLRDLEAALARAAARVGTVRLTLPSAVHAQLARDRALEQQRRRAAVLLEEAVFLIQRVRYEEALRKLRSAERAALDGLARFAQPRLLSDIYFHQGLVLLPMDHAAGQRNLVQSFLLWSHREMSAEKESPKILQAVKRAGVEAQTAPILAISGQEAARAARALGARFLLALTLRQGVDGEQMNLVLFDGDQALLRSSARSRTDHDSETIRQVLERAFPARVPTEQAVRPRRAWSYWASWGALGLAGATLVAGTGLGLASHSRLDEAESLAGRKPLVEYGPQVEDLERSQQRLQTAAIACLCMSGVAVAAAAVFWLWPRESKATKAKLTVGPGSVLFSMDLP